MDDSTSNNIRSGDPQPDKVALVAEVQAKLSASSAAIVTEYRGMNVAQITNLRRQLRDAGGEYRIYKNTLVRFAARNLDIELDDLLTGPTAIAFVGHKPDGSVGDAVAVAKMLRAFQRDTPALTVKGGVLGSRRMSAEDARALADMPPREQVLAELAGLLAAPLSQMAALLDAIPRNMTYALQALIDNRGGASAEPEAA